MSRAAGSSLAVTRRLLGAAVVLWLAGGAAAGASDAGARLRVGVSDVPPFAIHHPDGGWSGIAVDLWKEVALVLGEPFTFEEREPGALLPALVEGSLDVVVGPIAVTPEHEAVADFTQPYLSTSLAMAVRPPAAPSWWRILGIVLSPRLLHVLLGMALVTIALGTAVWLLERRGNSGHFEMPARSGLWSAVWWAAATITTVGYGDKTPRTAAGRAVAMAGMVGGILVVSVLTATFASEITLSHLRSSIHSPLDLHGHVVGTVAGSAGESWLGEHAVRPTLYPDVASALVGLEEDAVEAVVYHDAALRYFARSTLRGQLDVLPAGLEQEFLAFGLPDRSSLRERLNTAMLPVTHSDGWRQRLQSYLRP